jgi:hypothetical protein
MKLRCIHPYRSWYGTFVPGDTIEGDDETLERLRRDSPGSFEVIDPALAPDPPPDLDAMSTETATGLVTPDRRHRGGRKR